jgi:lipopolysaccharide transport system ATP-binding protein
VSGDTILRVSELSKKFTPQLRHSLAYGLRDIARELLPGSTPSPHLRPGEFWAVDDISFEVRRGESLAIVGRNGAGKSTLLKILYGLLKPDRGEVRIAGRTQAIIELGTGFNAMLTGRENIEVGAALHGLSRRDSRELLDGVIDFAEIGDFIDAPVQSYSSGMKARLSYALSAQLEPDLLLVDEVLAVGDLNFQRKCVNHMRRYLEKGGALLFVSHNTYQIQTVCERGLLLDRGRVLFHGSAVDTLNALFERRVTRGPIPAAATAREGPIVIEEVSVAPLEGDVAHSGEPLRVVLRYRSLERHEVVWGFSIWTHDQWVCVGGEYDPSPRLITPGVGEFSCVVPRLPLVGGQYMVRGGILDSLSTQPIALKGVYDSPTPLVVRDAGGRQANIKMGLNQLVNIDVDWC